MKPSFRLILHDPNKGPKSGSLNLELPDHFLKTFRQFRQGGRAAAGLGCARGCGLGGCIHALNVETDFIGRLGGLLNILSDILRGSRGRDEAL